MKIKNSSTEDLLKISEGMREEITRDVLESFGIDLSKQELVYHNKTKPVWTQQILDKKSLKTELDSFLTIIEKNIESLPSMIKFEKEHPSFMVESCAMDMISYDHEFLWICEAHVKKFEKEQYLKEKEITNYQDRIQEIKNKIKDITICESLKN